MKIYTTLYKSLVIGMLCATGVITLACSKKHSAQSQNQPAPDTTTQNKPAFNGRLVFHRYSCYDCNDSKILLYNFATDKLVVLSENWNIINPMNAHFSPDGNTIVFMGITQTTGKWDIYLDDLQNVSLPVNLTASLSANRNEDPKFSSDGKSIVFKSDGKLTRLDLSTNQFATYNIPHAEASMPYFINNDQLILYAAEKNEVSAIYALNTGDNFIQPMFEAPGIYAYYPIALDNSSFVFTRWHSASNHHDQLYIGYLNGSPVLRLPFNEPSADYSDGYPVDDKHLLLSSTRQGTKGGYDLYIGNKTSGQVWSLSVYNTNINATGNELGASYHP